MSGIIEKVILSLNYSNIIFWGWIFIHIFSRRFLLFFNNVAFLTTEFQKYSEKIIFMRLCNTAYLQYLQNFRTWFVLLVISLQLCFLCSASRRLQSRGKDFHLFEEEGKIPSPLGIGTEKWENKKGAVWKMRVSGIQLHSCRLLICLGCRIIYLFWNFLSFKSS